MTQTLTMPRVSSPTATPATTGKSILFVVNALGVGGAEIQVLRLAIGLRQRGWAASVVSMIPPAAPEEMELQRNGVDVHCLNMRAGIPNPLALLRLCRLVRQLRPDVVHSHIVHANVLTRLTRLIAPMRTLVCTAHNVQEGGKVYDLAYRYTDWLADLTTNVSQAAVDRYVKIRAAPAERIRFVPNGLNISRFQRDVVARERLRQELAVGNRFAWLAMGRFHEQKDYPNMIRAFAKSEPGHPSMLLIAGAGRLEDDTRKLVDSMALSDRVKFLGVRSDTPALLNMADGYLLSSAWEGMPLVLQEAGACFLPIVATNVGGNAEVVRDGVSGFLVPPRDDAALAGAMVRLMDMPAADRAAMGQAGRDHVINRYDLEHVLDRWEGIYQELEQVSR